MRIGLIIYDSLNTLTGGYLYDKFLVQHLREHGHTVDVISLTRRSYVRNFSDNFSGRLHRKLLSNAYDLLLQDELNHPSLFLLNKRIRQKLTCPIVAVVHQVLCLQPLWKFQKIAYRTFERYYLQSVDAFIFNSETTRTNIQYLVGNHRPSIVASPAGDRLGWIQSAEFIESKSHQSGPLNLIFVGNLTPNKGILALVTGLAQLPVDMWHLSLIGSLSMDRAYVRKVKDLIAHHALEDHVDLCGPLDGRDLVDRLRRSHVFVIPFSYEGFGIACLEAMAWGLPVIGSAEGAVKEFVHPGKNGFLVPPGARSFFSAQIENLHTDRNRLAQLGKAALNTFHGRPKWHETLEKIHSFLRSMAGGAENGAGA